MFRAVWWSKLYALAALSAILAGCATVADKSVLPATSSATDETVLVEEGVSSQPTYSPSGDRLLFVSAERPAHAQPQVYERDLATGEERRLTFQTGTTLSPRYHPREQWIVYASTTDELKENPPLLNPAILPSVFPPGLREPAEIYIHSLNGLDITRVTDRTGFDGDPHFTSDGRQLIWTRALKNSTQVVTLNRSAGTLSVVQGLGSNPSSYVASTDNKSRAWIEWDPKFEISKLKIRQGKDIAEINSEHLVAKTDPAFSPDSAYLTWSQFNAIGQHFEIWVYNFASRCTHLVVSSDSADRRHPVFSPDMKNLTYTLIRANNKSRIVSLPFVAPPGSCPAAE